MKTLESRIARLIHCTAAAAMLLLLSVPAFGQTATVTTDKEDYAPGETVIITGTGWQPGEVVQLVLHEEPFLHADRTLFATADASGNITNTQFAPEPHHLGVTFTLTATGQSSGFTAVTTFRDASLFWRGCTNSDWHTASNWGTSSGASCPGGGTVPTAADVVTIENVTGLGRPNPIISAPASVISATINSGATLNVQANFTLSDSVTVNGTWNQSAGTTSFTTSGKKITIFGSFILSGGTFGALGSNAPDFLIESSGSASQSGGTLNLNIFEVKVGRTFTQSGATSLLQLQKDWKNEGTFNSSGGRVRLAPGSIWASPNTATNTFFDIEWDAAVTVNAQTINVGGIWQNDVAGLSLNSGSLVQFVSGAANGTIGGAQPTTFGNLTSSKSGTLTLAQNITVGSAFNVTSGTFDHGASFNVTASGGITISAGATYRSVGSGDLTLGGNVVNNGTIQLNGVTTACGEADLVVIASTDSNSRTWSGTGTFDLQDVAISRQTKTGAPITVYSGTNSGNNVNFLFVACPIVAVCGNGTVEGAESCDDGANNGTANSCCTATCSFQPVNTACGDQDATACNAPNSCNATGSCVDRKDAAGSVCQASTGTCDPADVCDGTTNACAPVYAAEFTACGDSDATACNAADSCNSTGSCVDRKDPANTVCLAGTGTCDPNDVCDGTTNACAPVYAAEFTACGDPDTAACNAADSCNTTGTCVDRKDAALTECRASAGVCDQAETCDGTNNACPTDGFVTAGTECRADGGACDVAETCTGTSAACPNDVKVAAGTECRSSTGICDTPESCDGTSDACPTDGFASAATECRASAGVCDTAESCTGTGPACPTDGFVSAGTECRADGGACDVAEQCTGASATCPNDAKVAAGTECRGSAGVCDTAETCDGTNNACPTDAFASAATECRASAGVCDTAESCTGTGAACPADVLVAAGTECRADGGACDVAEQCTGASAACPNDAKEPATTVCRGSAGVCDQAESCDGINNACPNDGFVSAGTECRADGGACDVAEQCTGASATCPNDAKVAAGTECRGSAGVCDTAESCDGTTNNCPADGFQPATTVCRDSAGICDSPESCTGTGAACPADVLVAAGTECRADGGACDVAEQCTGASAACPNDAKEPATTVCRGSAGVCDQAESCDGINNACPNDGFVSAGTECRADGGACDVAEQCTGASATCPNDGKETAGTVCRASAGACDTAESCDGTTNSCPVDGFAPNTTACGSAGDGACDTQDTCSGTDNTCVNRVATAGTACGDAEGACTNADACNATGTCVDNGFKGPATPCGDQTDTLCNDPNTCSGTSGACLDNFVPVQTPCGDPSDTDCTNPDTCDGAGSCRDNDAGAGTTCSDGNECTENDVCDGSGACDGDLDEECAACVGNAPPVVTTVSGNPSGPTPITASSVTVTASFTDEPGQTHTCTFNWGDGSTPDQVAAQDEPTVGDPIGNCSSTHQYTATGVYPVTVTVTDECGDSGVGVYEYVVIYDPNGGFVTGGGWIQSPPGAYALDPAATGRANFGFVAKYKKGANGALEGETEFQFKAGDLNFHSTAYQWLVISGPKARYRGTGTVNGSGNFTFELTAWDGQVSGGGGVDKFRIKIDGIYDNQVGALDGADPTTALGGGSIVIHKPK